MVASSSRTATKAGSAIDFGTSIDCAGRADGVDRCASFGVESELFEALLPIPPIDLLTTATDIVGVRDETATARAWVGAETEPPEIEGLIFDLVVDPEAEVPATVRSATGVGFGDGFNLLVIDVPAMDDSILSTSWAAWIRPGSSDTTLEGVRVGDLRPRPRRAGSVHLTPRTGGLRAPTCAADDPSGLGDGSVDEVGRATLHVRPDRLDLVR